MFMPLQYIMTVMNDILSHVWSIQTAYPALCWSPMKKVCLSYKEAMVTFFRYSNLALSLFDKLGTDQVTITLISFFTSTDCMNLGSVL